MIPLLRPLGLSLLAFLAGLLPALRFAPAPLPLAVLASLAAVGAVAASLRHRRGFASATALAACFALAGAAAGARGATAWSHDCRAVAPDGTRVVAEGVLGAGIAPPERRELHARPPILPLERARIGVLGGSAACAGTELRLRLPTELQPLPAGTRLLVLGEWVRASGRVVRDGWPADPFYAGYVAVDSVAAVAAPELRREPLLFLRGRTETALRELFPRHSPLAEALVLGRRERLDPGIRDRFTRSGLVHLLAISGTHVGLFAGMILILGAAARMPRERLAWICIAAIAVYLAMIGAPASAVRAGIMLSLALLALVLQRPAAAVPVMAAAALLILVFYPAAILHVGFQLSFAGVIGILVARRAVLRRIPRSISRRRFVRPLLESVTVSAAAFAATAPAIAHHFGQVAPIAILANLVAAPATAVALSGVIGSLAVHPIAPPAARLLADGAGLALDVLDRTATLAAAVPLGHLPVPRPDWIAWMGAVSVACVVWRAAPRLTLRARRTLAAGSAAALLIAWPALARGERGVLELHFIDVGQGDAIAVRTPLDRWLLFDAGPRGATFDAGARRVLPFLHAHRVRRLEALVLTHPDADHIGGAPAVLRGIQVATVIDPGLPAGKDLYAEVLAAVEETGAAWRPARKGHLLELDGVEFRFLWPSSDFLDGSPEANDISAVVLVRYGEFEALLTGDASAAVERRIVAEHPSGLAAELLKAGHHGSTTSTSSELLAAVDPELVVITVGRRNRYGHPAPEVVSRIRATGTEIARTDTDGTITVRALAGAGARWNRIEY